MRIHPAEEELALYADGDLAASEIGRHVAGCEVCAAIVNEFRGLTSGFGDDLLDEDLAEVRAAVLSRLPQQKAAWGWWKWMPVPVGLATALIWLNWPVRQVVPAVAAVRASEPVIAAQPLPARTLVVRNLQRRPRRLPEAGLRLVSLVSAPGRPTEIHMTTADPNVVIVLQTEERTNVNE